MNTAFSKRHLVRIAVLLAFTLLLATMSSCGLSGILDDSGTIAIAIDVPSALTLVPVFDMTPASYLITGAGPNGGTFSLTTKKTTVSKSGVKKGAWVITVNALNTATAVVASGTGNAQVTGTQAVPVTVSVLPLSGAGSLSVALTWNTTRIPAAAFTGQLLPTTGAAIPLSFTLGAGTATGTAASVPAGYYTLTVQLKNGGATVMGAVEVARIIQGQTTSGSYDFTQATATGGTIVVGIVPVNTSPLTVTLSGQAAAIAAGSTMAVTASDGAYSGNVVYVWYVNGSYVGAGSQATPSLTFGANLAPGAYRLDVTALSADGLRAGAATAVFTVN